MLAESAGRSRYSVSISSCGIPNSEVAIVSAANTNGWTKGGTQCPGTQFEIGEPFNLPPTFVNVDENGEGSTFLNLAAEFCYVQAIAFESCEMSNTVLVP